MDEQSENQEIYKDIFSDETLTSISRDFIEVSKFHNYDMAELGAHINAINRSPYFHGLVKNHSTELGNVKKIRLRDEAPENGIRSLTLNNLFSQRKSIRNFCQDKLTLNDVSKLLLRSYYIIDQNENRRNIPSGGALFPIELYLLNLNIKGLSKGVYYYHIHHKELQLITKLGKTELNEVLNSGFNRKKRDDIDFDHASGIVLLTGVINRVSFKYKDRGLRFLLYDVGSINLCLYLIATQLGIGCCSNGGYIDDFIDNLLELRTNDRTTFLTVVFGKIDE